MSNGPRQILRGTTLVAAPMFLVGVIGCTAAVATALWAVWNPADLGVAFWSVLVVAGAIGIGGFVAARGCYIAVDDVDVCDVVAWITLRRIPRRRIQTVRVRAGFWRWFELELDDGALLLLVGASPAQVAARLLPSSRDEDLAALDIILGDE